MTNRRAWEAGAGRGGGWPMHGTGKPQNFHVDLRGWCGTGGTGCCTSGQAGTKMPSSKGVPGPGGFPDADSRTWTPRVKDQMPPPPFPLPAPPPQCLHLKRQAKELRICKLNIAALQLSKELGRREGERKDREEEKKSCRPQESLAGTDCLSHEYSSGE